MIRLIALKIGEEYGILKKHLLSFDAEFRVKVDDAHDSVSILIQQRQDCIKDFFGEKITGVTALVGRNGVGKSTLLRYLKELFIKEVNDLRFRHSDIILYIESNTIMIYANESIKSKISLRNETQYECEFVYYRKYPKLYDKVSDLSTVFYSNSLDSGHSEKETNNYFNISTGFLMENIGKINQRLKNKKIRSQSNHNRFSFTELKRQIDFIRFLHDHPTEIEIPFKGIHSLTLKIREIKYSDYDELSRSVRDASLNVDGENQDTKQIAKRRETITELLTEHLNRVKSFKSNEQDNYVDLLFNENLNFSLAVMFLKDMKLLPLLLANKNWCEFTIERLLASSPNISSAFGSFSQVATEIQSFVRIQMDGDRSNNIHGVSRMHLEGIIDDIETLKSLAHFYQEMKNSGSSERSSITFHPDDVSFIEFLEYYFESPLNFKFIDFNWARLSAGEESLIAFYSRLFTICRQTSQSNILILIDEGDLYFHPEWQRKYLFYLTKFLESGVTNLNKIQVILTSHSPFLVSDLMKENIIFLNKNINDVVEVIDSDNEMIPTFGGNIHTLFAKAFFMEGSTMSEFAWDKIQTDVLMKLDSTNLSDSELINMKLLVNKIGEPVLRNVLLEKLKAIER
jgi:energy-coupling factor transporter ATP-binding protein EcfA2